MPSTLILLPGRYAVCQLPADAAVPNWAAGDFVSVTRTANAVSIVCSADRVPADVPCEAAFSCLRVAGPLDFGLVGILSSLLDPLAKAAIPVFVVSTFDTDCVLVKERDLETAVEALRAAGHNVQPEQRG